MGYLKYMPLRSALKIQFFSVQSVLCLNIGKLKLFLVKITNATEIVNDIPKNLKVHFDIKVRQFTWKGVKMNTTEFL